MIHVSQGDEYPGETYIWCGVCNDGRFRGGPGLFEGRSIQELEAFLAEHEHAPQ